MTTVIEITPTRAVFNGGQFDTDFRYLRTTLTGVLTTMLAGPSIALDFDTISTNDRLSYRYQCGGYVIVAQSTTPPAPASVTNTATGIAL